MRGAPEPVRTRANRRLRSLALAVVIVLIWEGAKVLFAIPTYKLPHIHQIFAEFLRRTGNDELMLSIMAQNAAVTAV
jgi:ABC-type nitrate/sulfonate/bicarbonate transport system permease component